MRSPTDPPRIPDAPVPAEPRPDPEHSVPALPARPVPRATAQPREPHDAVFVGGAASRPLRAIDLVLATPERIGVNIEHGVALGRLAAIFGVAACLFAVPYGCVLGWTAWWKIPVLYLGSTLLCLPSLYVSSTYLGQRLRLEQILVLGFTIPAVAALFTFGFAPILGFLRFTMATGGAQVSWHTISNVLLAVAAAAGIAQLWRTWLASHGVARNALFPIVLLAWHAVFLHVLVRMGSVLQLGS